MNRELRLLWDFRDPDSLETAKHHVIYLNEFVDFEKFTTIQIDIIE